MNLWNEKHLALPPINTYKAPNNKLDIIKLHELCKETRDFFVNEKYLHAEYLVLSRVIYRMKQKFRSSKDFKALEKLTKALENYFQMHLPTDIQTFMDLIPSRYSYDETYLPNKNLLDYILVKFQGLVKLLERVVETSKIAAALVEERFKSGQFWKIAFIIFSLISRVYVLAKYIVNYICDVYKKLRGFSQRMLNNGKSWLPDDYELCEDLKTWLNVSWLDLKEEAANLEEPPALEDIMKNFFDLADDDDDVEFNDEYILIEDDKPEELVRNSKVYSKGKRLEDVIKLRGFDDRDFGEVIEVGDKNDETLTDEDVIKVGDEVIEVGGENDETVGDEEVIEINDATVNDEGVEDGDLSELNDDAKNESALSSESVEIVDDLILIGDKKLNSSRGDKKLKSKNVGIGEKIQDETIRDDIELEIDEDVVEVPDSTFEETEAVEYIPLSTPQICLNGELVEDVAFVDNTGDLKVVQTNKKKKLKNADESKKLKVAEDWKKLKSTEKSNKLKNKKSCDKNLDVEVFEISDSITYKEVQGVHFIPLSTTPIDVMSEDEKAVAENVFDKKFLEKTAKKKFKKNDKECKSATFKSKKVQKGMKKKVNKLAEVIELNNSIVLLNAPKKVPKVNKGGNIEMGKIQKQKKKKKNSAPEAELKKQELIKASLQSELARLTMQKRKITNILRELNESSSKKTKKKKSKAMKNVQTGTKRKFQHQEEQSGGVSKRIKQEKNVQNKRVFGQGGSGNVTRKIKQEENLQSGSVVGQGKPLGNVSKKIKQEKNVQSGSEFGKGKQSGNGTREIWRTGRVFQQGEQSVVHNASMNQDLRINLNKLKKKSEKNKMKVYSKKVVNASGLDKSKFSVPKKFDRKVKKKNSKTKTFTNANKGDVKNKSNKRKGKNKKRSKNKSNKLKT